MMTHRPCPQFLCRAASRVFRPLGWGCLTLLLSATLAWAAPSTTVTCAPPPHGGKVTLRLFQWVDDKGSHGYGASVDVDIPAGITAEQKAALIEAAINRLNNGTSLKVVRTGATLTITDNSQPPSRPYGVSCLSATDSTGEIMLVDNNSIGVPVDYLTTIKLNGTPRGGTATVGEDGRRVSVSTTNRSIMQIYHAWRAQFGQGTVTTNGLQLPLRHGELRNFYFEVTDPGLTVEVRQDMPNSRELLRLLITPVQLNNGSRSIEVSWPLLQPFGSEPVLERSSTVQQTFWLTAEHERRVTNNRVVVTIPAHEAQSFFRLRVPGGQTLR